MFHKLTYLIFAAASLLMTACSVYDDHMYGPNGEQKVNVSFVLALGPSGSPVTRAETWDPEDPTDDGDDIGYNPKTIGDGYDNMIDPGTLQVVFYEDTDAGDFVGQVTIKGYYPVDSEGNRIDTDSDGYMPESNLSNLYHFDGVLMADEGVLEVGTGYKLVVYANLPRSQAQRVNDGAAFSSLSDLKFTRFAYEGVEKDIEFIPMWGVRTVTLDMNQGELHDLGTIYVLRAMAKVEVRLGKSLVDAGYTLTGMNMHNVNGTGYILPTDALMKSATEELDLQNCFNELTSSVYVSPTVTSSNGSTSLVMYLPEKQNKNSDASEIGLTLNYNGGSVPQTISPSTTIKFTKYIGGKPSQSVDDVYNIVRNHNYVFEINSISSDGLKFIVSVKDLELGGVFGFIYDQEQS